MTKKTGLMLIAIILLASVASWYVWSTLPGNSKNQVAPASGSPANAIPAIQVSVLEIQPQEIALYQSLPGRISAFRQSQVRPQVNGIIMERSFEEGATVEEGVQLYQIDPARYEAALASAQADLQSAQADITALEAKVNRYEELVKIDAVSRQEYDDVKAQLNQAIAAVAVAEAAVKVAQVNFDYTKVYAPITGRIGRSFVSEGALVTANQGQPLTVITQLDPVYVDMQQSGTEAMRLQMRIGEQQEIPVSIAVGEDKSLPYPHKGILKFSEVTIDETTGSVTLRAVMPNPNGVLLPGLFVRGILDLGEQQALLVPQRASTRTPGGMLTIWVVESGKAQPRTIEVSGAYKDSWIVTAGLEAGEKVIVEGYQKVGPDMAVTPMPWKKPTERAESVGVPNEAPVETSGAEEQE